MALEYLLRTNEYNQPQVLSGKDAIATKLILLLNMKKGTDPRHPLMGIDMIGRYRYCEEEDIDELQQEINSQIEKYFPLEISLNTRAYVTWDDGELRILINSDDTTYAFTATEEGAVFTLDDAKSDNYPTLDDDEEEDDFDNETYADDLSQSSLTYPGDAGDIGY